MSRSLRALFVALSSLALLVASSSASGQHAQPAKFWPDLLQKGPLIQVKMLSGSRAQLTSTLTYLGAGFITYPQLKKNGNIIPGFKVTVTLPKGATVLSGNVRRGTAPGGSTLKLPASNFRWAMVEGKPTWIYRKIDGTSFPELVLLVGNLPKVTVEQKFSVRAAPMGVLHAPVQIVPWAMVGPVSG